jgi:hypothetical protein
MQGPPIHDNVIGTLATMHKIMGLYALIVKMFLILGKVTKRHGNFDKWRICIAGRLVLIFIKQR